MRFSSCPEHHGRMIGLSPRRSTEQHALWLARRSVDWHTEKPSRVIVVEWTHSATASSVFTPPASQVIHHITHHGSVVLGPLRPI